MMLNWKLVLVHLEIVLILVQDRCTVIWNLVSVRLKMVLVSVQDSCMVCTNSTIGSEFILDAPDGTPR
jgi:hypothetical protein